MLLKRAASLLPWSMRQALRAVKYRSEYASGRFRSPEPEYDELPKWIQPGDWILDLGANVGHYTLRMSELTRAEGRVIAFEPVIETAELLIALARRARYPNITVFQAAVSDRAGTLNFHVPASADGLPNYFQARVADSGGRTAICLAIDDLHLPRRISLVKIDVEQHEVAVLHGMRHLLARDRPVVIVEAHEGVFGEFFREHGYQMRPKTAGSPNLVFLPPCYKK